MIKGPVDDRVNYKWHDGCHNCVFALDCSEIRGRHEYICVHYRIAHAPVIALHVGEDTYSVSWCFGVEAFGVCDKYVEGEPTSVSLTNSEEDLTYLMFNLSAMGLDICKKSVINGVGCFENDC